MSKHSYEYKLFLELTMFGFLKSNPSKKLRKLYDKKSTDAMLAQRKGDIHSYAMLTAEAEELWKQIEALEQRKTTPQK